MAGTPLADLLFTVSIARILYVFRKSLVEDQLTSQLNINGNTHNMDDASFVDDGAIPVCASAHEIVSKVLSISGVAFRVFKCFNLDLNFSKGKSECIVSFHGKGPKYAIQSLARAGSIGKLDDIKGDPFASCLSDHTGMLGQRQPLT